MNSSEQKFRILMLITSARLAKEATDLFNAEDVPIHYRLVGSGTAPSEIMDILGLGSTEKDIFLSLLPKNFADGMLKKLRKELKLGSANSGIAFTIPMTSANNFVLKRLGDAAEDYSRRSGERKVENTMTESKYTMVAAIVDQGHGEAVMAAARSEGARGGTVIHARGTANSEAVKKFEIPVSPEKEMVMILVPTEIKDDILHALYRAVGLKTPGQGIAFSMPVDAVVGLSV